MKAAVYKLICNTNSKRCKRMLQAGTCKRMLQAGASAKIIDDATCTDLAVAHLWMQKRERGGGKGRV